MYISTLSDICAMRETHVRSTSRDDGTLKSNEKDSHKHMLYLCSFGRYNEFSVFISRYRITFTEDAQNDHLSFQGQPVDVFLWTRLTLEQFLVFAKFLYNLVLF